MSQVSLNEGKDTGPIICPKCRYAIHTNLHVPEGLEPFTVHVTFSCKNKYKTKHGMRRCGRPVVLTHDNGHTVAVFPTRWSQAAGMSLTQMLKRFFATTRRTRR